MSAAAEAGGAEVGGAEVRGAEAPGEIPVVLALGANLGDPGDTLDEAVAALSATPGLRVRAVSPYVTTAPVGGPAQPDYVNAVVLAATTLSPDELLARCHEVEAEHGRTREVRWGARTLDVDLIAYGEPGQDGEVVRPDPEPGAVPVDSHDAPAPPTSLVLPHPRAHLRAFVLAPWAAADPQARLRLPDGSVRPVAELLTEAEDRDGVRW